MKLPPASRKASRTFRLSSFDDPQPQSSPKVIVPRQSSETRRPDLPSSRYRIARSPWFSRKECFRSMRPEAGPEESQPPAGLEILARDPARIRRGEQGGGVGDVLDLADAPEGGHRRERTLDVRVFSYPSVDLGGGQAGGQGVHG